jgi:hypothetical protein
MDPGNLSLISAVNQEMIRDLIRRKYGRVRDDCLNTTDTDGTQYWATKPPSPIGCRLHPPNLTPTNRGSVLGVRPLEASPINFSFIEPLRIR